MREQEYVYYTIDYVYMYVIYRLKHSYKNESTIE